ncbi:RNA polymerase sigma factor [Nonomuraea roseoviolacea]|uniref:DNA-directed RNA polymerase specialized sigma24 family protein n=1 Tax=Nonomuraea roseoviolacea subsp. carminata TaxID=160689 RepID=A0ABT1K6Y6_9ACTN|nr:hypothetical protein [Nonomuraea roseoviolacea]MCP2349769.1 DNA-directed RNA polymerase specialized sigma24 family protein [Nonomuraea roseoviolacea subsp. carminata]
MWRTLSEDAREAILELCDGYGPHLYDYCRTELSSGDAELAVAGTLLSAHAWAERVDESSPLRPWLYALARAHRAYLSTPTSVGSWSRPGRMADLLPEALRALSPAHRELLDLSVRHGLTHDEIATIFAADADEVEMIVLEAADGLEEWFAAVIAARTRHGCAALESRVNDWAAAPGRRTRARISRHIAHCDLCQSAPRVMVADTLLRQMPISSAPGTLQGQLAWALPLPDEAGLWRADGFPAQARGLTEPAPPPISPVPGPTTGTWESSGPVAGAAAAGPEHTPDPAAHRPPSKHARPGPPDIVPRRPTPDAVPSRVRPERPVVPAARVPAPSAPSAPSSVSSVSAASAASASATDIPGGTSAPAPQTPGGTSAPAVQTPGGAAQSAAWTPDPTGQSPAWSPDPAADWAIVRRNRGGVPYRNLPAASAHDRISSSGPAGQERAPSRRAEGGPPWEHHPDDGPPIPPTTPTPSTPAARPDQASPLTRPAHPEEARPVTQPATAHREEGRPVARPAAAHREEGGPVARPATAAPASRAARPVVPPMRTSTPSPSPSPSPSQKPSASPSPSPTRAPAPAPGAQPVAAPVAPAGRVAPTSLPTDRMVAGAPRSKRPVPLSAPVMADAPPATRPRNGSTGTTPPTERHRPANGATPDRPEHRHQRPADGSATPHRPSPEPPAATSRPAAADRPVTTKGPGKSASTSPEAERRVPPSSARIHGVITIPGPRRPPEDAFPPPAGGVPGWARGRGADGPGEGPAVGAPPFTAPLRYEPGPAFGGQVVELNASGPDEFWLERPDLADGDPRFTVRNVARVSLLVGVGLLVAGLAWSGLNARQHMPAISETGAEDPARTPTPDGRPSPGSAVPVPPPEPAAVPPAATAAPAVTPAAGSPARATAGPSRTDEAADGRRESPVVAGTMSPAVTGTKSPADRPARRSATGGPVDSVTRHPAGTPREQPVTQPVTLPRPHAPAASLAPVSVRLGARRTGTFALSCKGGTCRVVSAGGTGGIAVSGHAFRVKAPTSRPGCPGRPVTQTGTIVVRWVGVARGDGRRTSGTTTARGTLRLRVSWTVAKNPGPYIIDGEGRSHWSNCARY